MRREMGVSGTDANAQGSGWLGRYAKNVEGLDGLRERYMVEVGLGRLGCISEIAMVGGWGWWKSMEDVTVAWTIAKEVTGRWTGWTDHELLRYAGFDVAR